MYAQSTITSQIDAIRDALEADIGSGSAHFYRHHEIPTDWSIHIHHRGSPPRPLGERLLACLQEFGSVYHGVWKQVPVFAHRESGPD